MPPRRVLGPGGRRRLGPSKEANKSIGAGGGGSSKADGGARLKGKIAVLKRAEKFGFISPLTDGAFDEEAPPPRSCIFLCGLRLRPSRLRSGGVTYAPPAQGTDRASHIELIWLVDATFR